MSLGAFANGVHLITADGQRMVALRDFSDAWHATVDYDTGRDAISISIGYQTVEVIPNSHTAWINNHQVVFDTPVQIIDDVTFLPVREICDAFGLTCVWSNSNQQVVVIDDHTKTYAIWTLDDNWPRYTHTYCRTFDRQTYLRVTVGFPLPIIIHEEHGAAHEKEHYTNGAGRDDDHALPQHTESGSLHWQTTAHPQWSHENAPADAGQTHVNPHQQNGWTEHPTQGQQNTWTQHPTQNQQTGWNQHPTQTQQNSWNQHPTQTQQNGWNQHPTQTQQSGWNPHSSPSPAAGAHENHSAATHQAPPAKEKDGASYSHDVHRGR